MEKVGRNDPCPCGSGKKYKKCCEEKLHRKKFEAQVFPQENVGVAGKAKMISTNFFQRTIAPKSPQNPPESEKPQI